MHIVRALQRLRGFVFHDTCCETWAVTIVIAMLGTLCTIEVSIIASRVRKCDLHSVNKKNERF